MEGYTDFNPSSDIKSLSGQVILVTGGTGGLYVLPSFPSRGLFASIQCLKLTLS